MDFNPLTKTCTEIERQIDALHQSEKQVACELQRYNSIDPGAFAERLQTAKGLAEKLRLDIQAREGEIKTIAAQLDKIARRIGTLWNPANWFAKDQVDLRDRHEQLCETRNQKAAQRQSCAKDLEDTRTRMGKITSDLQWRGTFDFDQRQSDLSQIKQSIAGKRDELAVVADRKRRVDEALAPFIPEIQHLESCKRRAESDLEAAQDLNQQLDSAGSSYERAMIHEQCERMFGEGRPGKIIVERRKKVRQLERDYDKAKRRVHEIARKAALKIETIVIDGNNLCYEGDTFIGLAAIEALLPLLSPICSVVVVFDSAIRRLLNCDDSGIKKRLGSLAQIHVVASGRSADETLLDLACSSEFTYVLSNDRFGDFSEKSAVKDGRIIRHEIVGGNVFVHDLQLRAAYG